MSNKQNSNELHIIVCSVTESIGLKSTAFDFVKSAAGDDFKRLDLPWESPPLWVRDISTLNVKLHPTNFDPYVLHLITFPEAIPTDFDLTDLLFPFPIDGLILTLDISSFGAFWDKANSKWYFPFKPIERGGGARWIRNPNIPCVLIATSIEPPLISIEQANQAFGLSPKIPTLFYPGKTRDLSTFSFFLTFEQGFVQAVFAELIKQIETADS